METEGWCDDPKFNDSPHGKPFEEEAGGFVLRLPNGEEVRLDEFGEPT